jgi:hypothetical protein
MRCTVVLLSTLLLVSCHQQVDLTATESQKQSARAEADSQITDPQALMPAYYRNGLKASYSVSTEIKEEGIFFKTKTVKDTVTPSIEYPLLTHSLWLGLLVYGIAAVFVFIFEVIPEAEKAKNAGKKQDDVIVGSGFGLLVCIVLLYGLAVLIAGIVRLASTAICPLIAGPGAHVPFDYALFVAHWFLMLGAILFVGYNYMYLPIFGKNDAATIAAQPSATQASERAKRAARAAIRCFLVAVLTTLGNQFGGWIAGLIALVVATVIASYIEPLGQPSALPTPESSNTEIP